MTDASRSQIIVQDYFKTNPISGSNDYAKVFHNIFV